MAHSRDTLITDGRTLETLLTNNPALLYARTVGAGCTFSFTHLHGQSPFGYDAQELLTNPLLWHRLLHPDDHDRVCQSEMTILRENGYHTFEYRFLHKNGTYRWAREEARIVRDPGQESFTEICIGYCIDITEQRWAQERLGRREQELAEAQRLAQMGSWSWNLRTNGMSWSDHLYRLYGLQPQEVKVFYEDFLARVHQDDRRLVQQHLEQARQERELAKCQFRIVRTDGVVRVIEQRGTVLAEPGEGAYRMYGTQQDVTEQVALIEALCRSQTELERRVEERTAKWKEVNQGLETEIANREQIQQVLRESEERFRLVFDAAPIGMALFDMRHQIFRVNTALCRMTGYTEAELERQPWMELSHPADRAETDRVAVVLAHGEEGGQRQGVRWLTKHGRTIWVNLTVMLIRNQSGETVAGLLMIQDVTDQKQAEAQLRKREYQLIEAQELAHLGNWEWQLQSNRITWSDELYRIYGVPLLPRPRTREEIVAYIHPADRDAVGAITEQACREQRSFSYFYRIMRPDGSLRILQERGHFVRDDGTEPKMVGTTLDVTELKQAEEDLQQAQRHLQAKNAELRALAAQLIEAQEEERRRISRELHDGLNQKLAVLAVNVDELEDHGLEAAKPGSMHMQRLRQQVADISDEVRQLAYHLHPAVLDHLGLDVALGSYIEECEAREDLTVDFSCENLPRVIPPSIASSLYRVAQEALRNIVKHACTDYAIVTLVGRHDGLELTVKDFGVGFKQEEQEPLRQSLGLVSMRERARLVHGDMTIQSIPGEGTEVFVRVPIRETTP